MGVASAAAEDTPLQKQTGKLVKTCAIIAGVLFVLVGVFTWLNIPDHNFSDRLIESILSGVTLAMAMIPEEFPVILTVFLSMGAWRLAKKHSLVRKLPSVETVSYTHLDVYKRQQQLILLAPVRCFANTVRFASLFLRQDVYKRQAVQFAKPAILNVRTAV